MELRFNGRKALLLADWLWHNPLLPRSRKQEIIERFVLERQPRYVRYGALRQQAFALLHAGMPVKEIAAELRLPYQTIYKWRNNP